MPRSGPEVDYPIAPKRGRASMRPGQSCPGVARNADRSTSGAYVGVCFNEAGAIMPRSGDSRLEDVRERLLCFNEAVAIMPRSGQRPIYRGGAERRASMRPGQSCPGVASP